VTKLVYIGGYGRSGSTLLEYLLTAQPTVVACGEVERHTRRFAKRKACSCGRPMQECPIWGAFQHESGRLKGWSHEQLTLALLDHVAKDYAVMVDSSKTAWTSLLAPFRLRRALGGDFLLVHLVRDPRGVAWSMMRWKPKKARQYLPAGARGLRAGVGWLAANLACEAFGRRYPDNYLKLRYEDLSGDPRQAINEIERRLGLPPVDLERGEEVDNRHQLYGNAMRFKELKLTDLKEDVAWKTAMPGFWRSLVGWITWPLRARYNYGGVEQPETPRNSTE
jgi:sulfotransferase family protein